MQWPDTLQAALEDQSSSIAIVGPVGSGKSTLAVFKIIGLCYKFAAQFPKTRWCVVRNTYRELKDTTFKTYCYWFPPKGYGESTYWEEKYDTTVEFGEYRSSDETVTFRDVVNGKPIEALIMFRSAEDAESVKKFKSLEISGYHIDEAIEVSKEVKLMLDNRIGRYPKGWPRPLSILTTNPPHQRHWVYKDYFSDDKVGGHTGYKQKAGENEANLPVGYYDRLRAAYANNPDWINRYIEGNWGIILEGEKVYPEFISSVENVMYHAMEGIYTPDKNIPIVRGWDIGGLTPACVFTQFIPSENRLVVFDEVQEFNIGIDRFADKLLIYANTTYPDFRFIDYADPAGWSKSATDERTCVEIMAGKGIYPSASEVNFKHRRESVAKFLNMSNQGRPCMKVVKDKCPLIYDGFIGGYHYPKNKDGLVLREAPVKNEYSHAHDALQYAAARVLQAEYVWMMDN